MTTFMLAMVRYPEVYRKLQEEIDQVVGNERLPDFDDRVSLPYTECVIKETYRLVYIICGAAISVNLCHKMAYPGSVRFVVSTPFGALGVQGFVLIGFK